MDTYRNPARRAIALGAGLALTLAACGGGDDDTTEPVEIPTSPATLTLGDQDGDGTVVVIDAVDLPADGFVAIHGDGGGSPGPVIGVSDLLPAGATSDVTVTLDETLDATGVVFPMVHIDTNANGIYEFGTVEGVDGPGVTADGDVAVGPLTITIATDDGTGDEATAEPTTDGDNSPDDGVTITIADFAFGGVTEVAVGTTVVVTNTDAAPHTWSADDGAFDSGALGEGETFEFTFTEAGEFAYHCNFHPSMTGTIVVTG